MYQRVDCNRVQECHANRHRHKSREQCGHPAASCKRVWSPKISDSIRSQSMLPDRLVTRNSAHHAANPSRDLRQATGMTANGIVQGDVTTADSISAVHSIAETHSIVAAMTQHCPPCGRSSPMMRSWGFSSAVYTAKLAGEPECGCTLTPHSSGSRWKASRARRCTTQDSLVNRCNLKLRRLPGATHPSIKPREGLS